MTTRFNCCFREKNNRDQLTLAFLRSITHKLQLNNQLTWVEALKPHTSESSWAQNPTIFRFLPSSGIGHPQLDKMINGIQGIYTRDFHNFPNQIIAVSPTDKIQLTIDAIGEQLSQWLILVLKT